MALPIYHGRHHHPFPTSMPIPPPSSKNMSTLCCQGATPTVREACNRGRLGEAFLTFGNLSNSSMYPRVSPSQEDYSSILDLCASHKASFQGQQIHGRLLTSGSIGDDAFLGTKLLFMYGKCGCLLEARKLFDCMLERSVFAWNALIGAYASYGNYLEAVVLYREMRASGTLPDAYTFASVLKACAAIEELECGVDVHGLSIKCGTVSNVFVVNALVSMYARCERYHMSRELFQLLPEKSDIVSWNSIISACLHQGRSSEALEFFREMQRAGIGTNSYTVVGALQACTDLALPKLAREIHASVLKCSRPLEIFEANALVVVYARSNLMDHALQVFREMNEKDNVSWNSLLSGYVQQEYYTEAISLFYEMQSMGFRPDHVSIISIASASGRLGKLRNVMEIHAYAVKQGLDSDLQVGNTLMDMYTKCSCFDYAQRVFRKMPHKDFISWTTAITGYAQKGQYWEALDLFRKVQKEGMKVDAIMLGSVLLAYGGLASRRAHVKQIHGYTIRHDLLDLMLENTVIDAYGDCGEVGYAMHVFKNTRSPDVVSWTSLINCHVQNGFLSEAMRMFCDMVNSNVEPDGVALSSILSAASGLSSLRKGKEIHGFLVRNGFSIDKSIGNSLVNMYASCGNLKCSYKIFDDVEHKDLVLWTSLISACGMHGRGRNAILMFRRMLETGLKPDHVSFLALLYACCHSGLVDEGKMYLEVMKSDYGLEPWPDHYACVVDLLGRSGRIQEAYEFITDMPIEPTTTAWCALLGACRVHSNREIGGIAARRLLELQPENPGNYVLVSNVFAAAGKWDDVDEVRRRMQEIGLKKNPACSWIEIGDKIQTFRARDDSHPESGRIYSKLEEITEGLKRDGGYVEDSNCVLHNVPEEEKMKMLHGHSERLAIAYALISTREGATIRISKNLRVCDDCHEFTKLISKAHRRKIVVRDSNRFHHFEDGSCSCGDFW